MTDLKKRILERVEPDLFQINKALAENLDPKTSLVEKVAGHILFAGGKFFQRSHRDRKPGCRKLLRPTADRLLWWQLAA